MYNAHSRILTKEFLKVQHKRFIINSVVRKRVDVGGLYLLNRTSRLTFLSLKTWPLVNNRYGIVEVIMSVAASC